jgi:hypothetical protein
VNCSFSLSWWAPDPRPLPQALRPLELPPEQPSDDGPSELPGRASAVIEGRRHQAGTLPVRYGRSRPTAEQRAERLLAGASLSTFKREARSS